MCYNIKLFCNVIVLLYTEKINKMGREKCIKLLLTVKFFQKSKRQKYKWFDFIKNKNSLQF